MAISRSRKIAKRAGSTTCAFSVYIDTQFDAFNAADANTTIPYSTKGAVLFDNGGDYDLSNNKFTAPFTGFYQFNLKLRIEQLTTGNFVVGFLRQPGYTGNGGSGTAHASRSTADIIYSATYAIRNSSDFNTLESNALLFLNKGQEIEHGAYIQTDTAVRLSDRGCHFQGYFVGPKPTA